MLLCGSVLQFHLSITRQASCASVLASDFDLSVPLSFIFLCTICCVGGFPSGHFISVFPSVTLDPKYMG